MQVRNRDEIEEKYTWKTEDMIADKNEWDRLYDTVKNGVSDIVAFNGKLKDKKNILACLKTSTKYEDILSRMFCYAHMKRDQDVGNGENKALYDSVRTFISAMPERPVSLCLSSARLTKSFSKSLPRIRTLRITAILSKE